MNNLQNITIFLLLDIASHGLAFFIVTGKPQRQNFFQNLLKTEKLKMLILQTK